MTGVSIPSTVTQIGGSAFADCVSLESAIIPKSIALIYDDAFSGCLKLTNLVIEEDNQALNVEYHAAGGQGAFTEEQYKNVKLTIPVGSLAAYQEDGVWKNFLNMEEKESTGIGNVETADGKGISVEDGTIVVENAEGDISVYNMAGQLVKSVNANGGRMKMSLPRHGIYIVKAGSLAVKVVL